MSDFDQWWENHFEYMTRNRLSPAKEAWNYQQGRIEELEARIDNASNIYHEKVHIWPLVAAAQMIDALRPQPPEVDDDR